MSSPGRLVVVVGSRGGAGTSCLAASIAKAVHNQSVSGAGFGTRVGGSTGAEFSQRCVLVDLCAGGPGLEVLLGIEREPGARWPELEAARGEVDGAGLVLALPQWFAVPVLSVSRHHSQPVPDEVVLDVCAGLLRNGAMVILDIPAPAAWTPAIRALISSADQTLIATPDTTIGLAGAVAVAAALDELAGKSGLQSGIVLRVRNGSRVTSIGVEKLVGMPVIARFREDRHLPTALELGAGPVSKVSKRLWRAGAIVAETLVGDGGW